MDNKVSSSTKYSGDRVLQRDKKVEQDMEILVQIIVRLYCFYFYKYNNVRRLFWNKKDSRKNRPKPTKKLKYGIEVPHNVVRAKDIDDENIETL